jgi:hypothetical protein
VWGGQRSGDGWPARQRRISWSIVVVGGWYVGGEVRCGDGHSLGMETEVRVEAEGRDGLGS